MQDSIEFRKILAKLLDGDLSDDEFARLEERLRSDEAARDIYVQQVVMSAHLERLHAVASELTAQRADGFPVRQNWLARRWRQGIGLLQRYPVVSCAAALVVIVGLVGMLALVQTPIGGNARAPLREAREVVAELAATHDARWQEGQVGVHHGANFLVGHKLILEEGRAEISFKRGSQVVIRGPAELIIESDNSARLVRGALAARVPQESVGFQILTPGATVVDLGTEFAVSVEDAGDCDVHVFNGVIDLTLGEGHTPMRVVEGQSRRVAYNGRSYEISQTMLSEQRLAGLKSLTKSLPRPEPIAISAAADSYVAAGHSNEGNGSAQRLLTKRDNTSPDYEREIWIAFDVSQLAGRKILGARLKLTVDWHPGNPEASKYETGGCRFVVYGVEESASEAFDEAALTWQQVQTTPRHMLGMFRLRGRGQRGETVAFGGGQLARLVEESKTGRLTLGIARHDLMKNVAHAFASREHSELAGPVLEVWCEEEEETETAVEGEAALPAAEES